MRPGSFLPPEAQDSSTAQTVRAGAVIRTIGPYQLLERLGTGGMGEVWKARDRLLNRIVALKFISAREPGSSPPRDLLHEARAASALNHPNIVTIFQIAESEGATYLAMEFVQGESLRHRLRHARVAMAEALEISRQIVDGLSSAHAHGIIHRDLKPENIMLRVDGCVKLVDFGLAKVLPWEDVTTGERVLETSDSGQLVGTFNYMSPEQARSRPISAASDVFSLGIVMYELFTGEHPFHRASVLDTLNAIISEEPPPIDAKAPSSPPHVASIVARALRKDPSTRYSSAVEVSEELKRALRQPTDQPREATAVRYPRRWVRGIGMIAIAALAALTGWVVLRPASEAAFVPAVQSVAVMTLRSQGGDTRAAALAEGLPEDLGSALSSAGFRVASRSSVLDLGEGANARTIAEELGVDAVLAGNVRSYGDGLRVYVELVSARSRFQIWSGTFTSSGEDLIGSAPQVAGEIASRLQAALAAR